MNYKEKKYQIDKKNFIILNGKIYYRTIPMWSTVSISLENFEFYMLDETTYPNGFVTITCKDECGDLFYYGRFDTIKQATQWLVNPVSLY